MGKGKAKGSLSKVTSRLSRFHDPDARFNGALAGDTLESDMPEPEAGHGTEKREEEPPPFLGSWRNIYAAIALYLVALIALFTLFTRSFNR